MMIKVGEEYETVCGFKVRIYATDGAGSYPVHGAFYKEGKWWPLPWTEHGRYLDTEEKSRMDIKLPNTRIKQDVWMHVYKHINGAVSLATHPVKQRPDTLPESSPWTLVACYPHTVDVEEGEGL